MADSSFEREHPRKRARLVPPCDNPSDNRSPLRSLDAPITPPQRRAQLVGNEFTPQQDARQSSQTSPSPRVVPSPFQLTWIRDLPAAFNSDTVTLKDLLGDPLISECWEFNYIHDIDFLMEAFDPDIRDIVKVHVVHGFWKQEEGIGLKTQASKYANVTLHTAYMPEAFGTHHTKMMVLLRHDDLAQIIIHTANLIERDWTNMSQAVWRSPLLPISSSLISPPTLAPPIGSGAKFKIDFLNYLRAYDNRRTICKPLAEKLDRYDFSGIRGALIGSVPGRHHVDSDFETKWGWQALSHALNSVSTCQSGPAEVVIQVSSIATLGQTDKWLDQTLFKSLGKSMSGVSSPIKYAVIFPTADEIRRSLDGYYSGHSIHTRIQTPAQAKQLQYLKPILNHWAGDGVQHGSNNETVTKDAGRKRAAPHIKTYVRFSDAAKSQIDWALVTSANISKQAWGEACNANGDVRICSYELGVLVWPDLFSKDAKMVPTFKQDLPATEKHDTAGSDVLVGFRMPYDLPLVPYAKEDEPWCATKTYAEPDWRGQTWPR